MGFGGGDRKGAASTIFTEIIYIPLSRLKKKSTQFLLMVCERKDSAGKGGFWKGSSICLTNIPKEKKTLTVKHNDYYHIETTHTARHFADSITGTWSVLSPHPQIFQ